MSDIEKFTGHPAMEPIRIYAGLASAKGAEAQAALAVKDLQRAGGFQRKYLVVVTTTGSGWVDPALVDSFEYLTGGDCATVAIQYSYLPSWISYLVDQAKALAAGRALFDAVYGAWAKMPAGPSPQAVRRRGKPGLVRRGGRLYRRERHGQPHQRRAVRRAAQFQHAVPGVQRQPRRRAAPRSSRSTRTGGSCGSRMMRAREYRRRASPGMARRVLYLMHPSDPIVWWSPHLIFSQPDWISEPPGKDVLKTMFWMPFITFWQVTADLPFATGVPGGHGHRYSGRVRRRVERHHAARRHHLPGPGQPQEDHREVR